MIWKKTTEKVFLSIWDEHRYEMQPFGTCSCPMGDMALGKELPYMYTEWGFKGAKEPIIRSIGTKETMEQEKYDWVYEIATMEY